MHPAITIITARIPVIHRNKQGGNTVRVMGSSGFVRDIPGNHKNIWIPPQMPGKEKAEKNRSFISRYIWFKLIFRHQEPLS
jgi:hypothetical protein